MDSIFILLDYLLADPDYDSVTVFSRRALSFEHPKLTVHIIDLMDHKSIENLLNGDVVFVNIGTTLKKTPDKELYFSIDHGIPVNVSRIAKTNGFKRILVVSSMGADANSTVFYNRTKGQMEKDVIDEENRTGKSGGAWLKIQRGGGGGRGEVRRGEVR
mgnify:CR=1 FL=1